MYEIRTEKQFRSAYKRVSRSGRFEKEAFEEVILCLQQGLVLPEKYYDHALSGNLAGHRECHIASDLLLIYELFVEEKIIILNNIGNHAQVFGS